MRVRVATTWAWLTRVPGPVWAGLVLAGLELVAFWRPLTGGGVLSAATAAFGFVPFRAYAPSDLGSFYNPLLADSARAYVPWLMFARDALRSGGLPQWNPYVLAGSPFLANQQSSLFSPLNLPVWLLPFDYGIGFAAVLKLWLAGLGMFLAGRQLRLGFWPSLVSAVTFGWAPFLIVWNQLPTVTNVWVAFPWAVLACERLCLHGRRGSAVGLAAASAVALTGGHPGSQIHFYTGVALYLAIRLALLEGLTRRARIGRLAMGFAAMGLAAAIAAITLLPSAMLVPGSVALETHTAGGGVRPLSTLRTIVFPDWWGRPSGRAVPAPSNFTEGAFYVGAAPLLLALIGLFGRDRWRAKAALAAMVGLGLAVPLGVPGIHTFFADTPPWSHVFESRMIVLLDFGAALLAGFGARDLLQRSASRRAWVAAAGGLVVAVAGVVAVSPSAGTVHLVERHFLHGVSYASAPVLALTSVVWWAAFAVAFAVVVAIGGRVRGPVIGILLVALVAADLGHFLDGYQPVAPARDVYGFTPRSIAFVRAHQGSYRSTAIAGALPSDMGMVWGLRDIRGYDPPLPTLRYWRFFQKGSPPAAGPPNGHPHFFRLTAADRRVLDALSVRYVLTGPGARAPSLPGFRVVYRGNDATVLENLRARPRAFVAGGDGSVAFVHDGDGMVSLTARMRRPGTVVLADQFAAGWSVSVDGRDARPRRYDSVLRGVAVPAGRHRIVWRYRTPGLTAGALLSLAGLVLATIWLTAPWRLVARVRARASAPEQGQ